MHKQMFKLLELLYIFYKNLMKRSRGKSKHEGCNLLKKKLLCSIKKNEKCIFIYVLKWHFYFLTLHEA